MQDEEKNEINVYTEIKKKKRRKKKMKDEKEKSNKET